MIDEQLLADAKDAFALCEEAESENRLAVLDDLRFAKLASSGRMLDAGVNGDNPPFPKAAPALPPRPI
jgi:hypothetical protein